MSEIKSESVSSLVDDNLASADPDAQNQLVENLLKDEELSNTWQNYHLIGDVLRDEVPETLTLDLSDEISAAIAQEATILSPNSVNSISDDVENSEDLQAGEAISINESADKVDNTSSIINAKDRFKQKVSTILKPAGQVAIAASAAVLMIVGVQHNVADNTSPIAPSQVVQTVPLGGYANPVSFDVRSNQTSQAQINEQKHLQAQQLEEEALKKIAQQRRLQALLKDHNQQSQLSHK